MEDRGWLIYRIWSTDWFKDRPGQVARIMDLIQKAREKASVESTAKLVVPSATNDISGNNIQETSDDLNKSNLGLDLLEDGSDGLNPAGYVQPTVTAYQFANRSRTLPKQSILDAPIEQLARVIADIVKAEGPIHMEDLIDRIVSFWNTKAGKRVVAQIKAGCNLATRMKLVIKKADFFFANSEIVSVRSRSGLKFVPEHISPEEYREAVLLILRTGNVFSRRNLTNEVRELLGFGRTTTILDELIGRAIDGLLLSGIVGDASNGIVLRR